MPQVAASSLPQSSVTPIRPTLVDALREDAHWQGCYWRECYYRPGFGYEDYAPAYCVGYVGYAQYGGSFEDAEKSLLANWLRIRGDSRLGLDDAGLAMRAAWIRMERAEDTAPRLREMPALVADALGNARRDPQDADTAPHRLPGRTGLPEHELRASP